MRELLTRALSAARRYAALSRAAGGHGARYRTARSEGPALPPISRTGRARRIVVRRGPLGAAGSQDGIPRDRSALATRSPSYGRLDTPRRPGRRAGLRAEGAQTTLR